MRNPSFGRYPRYRFRPARFNAWGASLWWRDARAWARSKRDRALYPSVRTLAAAAAVGLAVIFLIAGVFIADRQDIPARLGRAFTVAVSDAGVPYVALVPDDPQQGPSAKADAGSTHRGGASAVPLFPVGTVGGVFSIASGSSIGNHPQPPRPAPDPKPGPGPGPTPAPAPSPTPGPTTPPPTTEPPPTTAPPPTTDPPPPTTEPPPPTTNPPPTTEPPPTTDPPQASGPPPTTDPPATGTERFDD